MKDVFTVHVLCQLAAGGRYLASSDTGCVSSERSATTADNSSTAAVTQHTIKVGFIAW